MKEDYIYKEVVIGSHKIGRHFSAKEMEFLPSIDSLFFIDTYLKEGKNFNLSEREIKEYCLNNLQTIFYRILNRFLQAVNEYHLNKFIKEQLQFYLFFRKVVSEDKKTDYKKPTELVISLYQDLNEVKNRLNPEVFQQKAATSNKYNHGEFKKSGWQYSTINFLKKRTEKKLNKFITCFLVHGSFATRDFLENWSDLDTLIILNAKTFENTRNLDLVRKEFRKLAFLCHKINPPAHHHFDFFTDFDLNYYPSYLFPPVLYDYALLLFGVTELNLKLRDDRHEKIQILANFVHYFRRKVMRQEYSKKAYEWKNDLGKIMLFPTLLLQAKNINLYKKYSFTMAEKEFPQIDFSVVKQATQMMKDWPNHNLLRYYPNFLFNLLPAIYHRVAFGPYLKYLIRLPVRQSRKDIETISKEGLSFFEKSFNLILQNL